LFYIIEEISIDGVECDIYVNCSDFPYTEIGIKPWYKMDLRGEFMERLARKIAEDHKVSFKKENFGGHTGGNPPFYKRVFTVQVKEGFSWREYLNPAKKEIEEEIENAKNKLIEVIKKVNQAVNEVVEKSLHI